MKSTKKLVGIVVLSLILFLCNSGLLIASDPGEMNAKAQIADLMVCYASGADAIGDGVTQAAPKQPGWRSLRPVLPKKRLLPCGPRAGLSIAPLFPTVMGVCLLC
jgi:hypothetical protein